MTSDDLAATPAPLVGSIVGQTLTDGLGAWPAVRAG